MSVLRNCLSATAETCRRKTSQTSHKCRDRGHSFTAGVRSCQVGRVGVKPDGNCDLVYLVSRFPSLSETFIYNELLALQQDGFSVGLMPMMRQNAKVKHAYIAPLLEVVEFMPPIASLRHLQAHAYFLRHAPGKYVRALRLVVSGTWRRPLLLGKSLYAFGKGVACAFQIRERRVGHLHAHWATMPTTAALVIASLLDIPFSFTAHAWDIFKEPTMLAEKMRRAEFVVTISEYNSRYLQSLCPDLPAGRIAVVRCGIDLGKFPYREPHHVRSPLIVSVARLVEKKGLRWLVEACALLRGKRPELRCQIVGQGPQKSFLESLIAELGVQEQVSLLGSLPHEEVQLLLRRASMFVLPCVVDKSGDRDGIPVALMEAMASGVPVISTAISGIPELVQDGVTGLLVPDSDARALAGAIERLLDDPELGLALSRNARRRVLEEYDIERNIRRKESLFRSCSLELA